SVIWQHDSGIILKRIAGDMLSTWPVHGYAWRSRDINADFLRIVHPHPVFGDVRLKSCVAEFPCHIFGSSLVLRRSSNMRGLGQGAQMLFSKLCVRHRQEPVFDSNLLRRIAETK